MGSGRSSRGRAPEGWTMALSLLGQGGPGPPPVPLGALPDIRSLSSCKLRGCRSNKDRAESPSWPHGGALTPHWDSRPRWSRNRTGPFLVLGWWVEGCERDGGSGTGAYRALCHSLCSLGPCLPRSLRGLCALGSLTLWFLTEKGWKGLPLFIGDGLML